jgi:hypothetical protein
MNVLFENKHTRNKELAKEIYKYYYFQRKIYVFAYTILWLSFFANLVIAIAGEPYNVTAFVCAPLLFSLSFFLYHYQVNTLLKRDMELYGKEIEVETVVTDELIHNTAANGAVNEMTFDKIKGAVQTKNLILLRTKANMVWIFRKDSFSVGSKEEFISFLKNKGIKVKGK